MVLAGATVVEVCSAIIAEGPAVLTRFISALEEYLDRHSIASLDYVRGIVCDRLTATDDVDRRNRFFAAIAPGLCTSCGVCGRVCIYDAISEGAQSYAIDPDACDGCGLCLELCPTEAIALHPRPTPLER
jgi:dihydroorotate dehydrogenase (fumarate)